MNDQAPKSQTEHPSETASHVVASKGLLGILKEVGHANMQDPEKHVRVLKEAKDHHMVKKEFPDVPKPKTLGGKLGHHIASGDHEKAAETISGHPLTGLVGKTHMKSAMEHLSAPVVSQEPHPVAFKGAVDYLSSAHKGRELLSKHVISMIGGKGSVKPDAKKREELKNHLDDLSANPSKMLETGGSLGHYLPDHSAQITSLSATAVNYLSSLKPKNVQESPFDAVLAPSKAAMAIYDRQVDIAQNPLLVLQHAKTGTLMPTDIATLQTIYPVLHKKLVDQVGEQLIEVKSKGMEVPYKMRSSLSMLLGQPLDSTMTSKSMQAIIASAGPRGPQGPKKSAPATTLKAADKVTRMSETPLQAREANKKP